MSISEILKKFFSFFSFDWLLCFNRGIFPCFKQKTIGSFSTVARLLVRVHNHSPSQVARSPPQNYFA
jgi:hypothetical protein